MPRSLVGPKGPRVVLPPRLGWSRPPDPRSLVCLWALGRFVERIKSPGPQARKHTPSGSIGRKADSCPVSGYIQTSLRSVNLCSRVILGGSRALICSARWSPCTQKPCRVSTFSQNDRAVCRKEYRACGNVRPKPFVVVVVFGPLLRTPSTTVSSGALGNPIARAARVVRSSGLGGGLSVLGPARFEPGHHRTARTFGHILARTRLPSTN